MSSRWERLYSALKTIKSDFGDEIVSEPARVKSILLDLVPELKNEVKAFTNILCDADINRYICNHNDIQERYIITQIENDMGLSSEWARYITKGLIILTNHSELNTATTYEISDSKPVNRKKRTKRKKDLSEFWSRFKIVVGLIILLTAIVFGLYAWFADIGLTRITYYLILTGIGFLGMFFLHWGLDFDDIPGAIETSIVIVICIVFGVSVIGLIGNWIINLIQST